jgi:chorismate-pyruvate lyase
MKEPAMEPVKVLPLAFPLDDFYARAGLRLPVIETIEPVAIPEPYRSLLVHHNDMTPTLSAYYARIIHLRVLSRQQRDEFYFREVVLLADGREDPVEFGAIRINLGRFAPKTRRHILDERVPLGDLLRMHSVPHSSQPKAFFRLEADALMADALRLAQPEVLYGRRNTLLDAAHRPVAEVVEILPPCREPGAGYVQERKDYE